MMNGSFVNNHAYVGCFCLIGSQKILINFIPYLPTYIIQFRVAIAFQNPMQVFRVFSRSGASKAFPCPCPCPQPFNLSHAFTFSFGTLKQTTSKGG